MDRPISSLMSASLTTVRADDSVEAVSEQLRQTGLSFAPVEDRHGVLIGIISVDDILRIRATGRDPSSICAWEICSYKPVEVDAGASVSEVARLMVDQRVHHVLVVKDQAVAGVVSSLDFVKEFIEAG